MVERPGVDAAQTLALVVFGNAVCTRLWWSRSPSLEVPIDSLTTHSESARPRACSAILLGSCIGLGIRMIWVPISELRQLRAERERCSRAAETLTLGPAVVVLERRLPLTPAFAEVHVTWRDAAGPQADASATYSVLGYTRVAAPYLVKRDAFDQVGADQADDGDPFEAPRAISLRPPSVRRRRRDVVHAGAGRGVVDEARERAARAIQALTAVFDVTQ